MNSASFLSKPGLVSRHVPKLTQVDRKRTKSSIQKYINRSNTIKIHKNQNFAAEEKMHYMVIFYESWSLAMIRNGPTVR